MRHHMAQTTNATVIIPIVPEAQEVADVSSSAPAVSAASRRAAFESLANSDEASSQGSSNGSSQGSDAGSGGKFFSKRGIVPAPVMASLTRSSLTVSFSCSHVRASGRQHRLLRKVLSARSQEGGLLQCPCRVRGPRRRPKRRAFGGPDARRCSRQSLGRARRVRGRCRFVRLVVVVVVGLTRRGARQSLGCACCL